jgi:hypothetical protein
METTLNQYKEIVERFYKLMCENIKIADIKLTQDKWTLKEMVGHLIDSASNNHQRFIRLQIDERVTLPGYEAEAWNSITKIKSFNYKSLIDLWKLYNDYLLHILDVMDPKCLKNIWISANGDKELEFIIKDYFRHLEWHEDLFKERVKELEEKET